MTRITDLAIEVIAIRQFELLGYPHVYDTVIRKVRKTGFIHSSGRS